MGCIGLHLRRNSHEVKNSTFFAVLIDVTTDISKKEQVSVVLRFVNAEGVVEERFVQFVETEDTSGAGLAKIIEGVLCWGLC